MASSFDLFRNPFVLLGLDLSASARRVADAFEDAVADGHASESELVTARQAILTPLSRLKAEVGALADTPSSEWRSILTALKSSQTSSRLRQAFAKVAPLSRSNLLTHLSSRTHPDAPMLSEWVATHSAINLDQIHRQIVQFREIAGVVRPERASLSAALGDLREQQARSLFDGFEYPPDAIEPVTGCTKQIISAGDTAQIDVLGNMLKAYNYHIEQELSFRRQRITSTADALRSDPDGMGNLALVVDALKFWDQAAHPLQLLEAYKGRDEPSAQEVFQQLRTLAIDLANDLSRFDLSLSITKSCQAVFAGLPRAVQRLGEDQTTLEERVQYSKINPLAIAIGELGDDLHKLADELRTGGFSQSAVGSAKSLRDAFVASVKASKNSAIAEMPWLMLRSIVIKLNNDLDAPDSALAMMQGLLDLNRELDASEEAWLLQNFDLSETFQTDGTYQRLLRVAQHHCEVAKIALSTKPTDRIFADENQIGAKDKRGKEIYLDVEVTRRALEALIKDDITRSIELCQSLLKDSGYRSEDIDRVVMIGGPSRMPIVRNSVTDQLGIAVDTDTDPMTAVATGAAIFSEGRDWGSGAVNAKSSRGTRKPKGPLDIRYDFPARTADDRVRIRVRSGGSLDKKGYRLVVDTVDGWTSGQIALGDNLEINDVPLGKQGENVIRITVLDANSTPLADAVTELSIFRALAAADGMPITHTIAVKVVVKGTAGAERNILSQLVKKGTPLPASEMDKFRAARDLRAGDGTSLDFELFEQAEGVDEPELNLPIGVFRITSDDLDRGDVIRKGDEVFVRWSIDGNGLLNSELEIPSISKLYSPGRMYVSTRDHRNFDGEDGIRLAAEVIDSAEEDIHRLDRALGSNVAREIGDLQDRVTRQREQLRLSHEADARRRASEEGRLIRQEVARIRSSPENRKTSLRSEIDEFVEMFGIAFAKTSDPKMNAQINRLAGHARDALMRDDPNSIDDARRSLDEMRAILFSDLAKQPGFWVGMFEDIAKDRHRAIDKTKHDRLVNEGEGFIRKEDLDGLRQITFQLRDNMVRSADASSPDVLAGLMR